MSFFIRIVLTKKHKWEETTLKILVAEDDARLRRNIVYILKKGISSCCRSREWAGRARPYSY